MPVQKVQNVQKVQTENTILARDCVAGMRELGAAQVDLVFADPPFNIGYSYDVYDDRLAREHYLDWSRSWISAVYDCLKPDGTFWLAIGDEYAAELKLIAQEIGFETRSWVIWYYTFGVNCKQKFSRSHAHLFYFTKHSEQFTFAKEDLENRIPSARQLVYNDKRANPSGRLPDDTWIIPPAADLMGAGVDLSLSAAERQAAVTEDGSTWTLRPQDIEACFRAEEDTWYFPRVAGTFKERAGFHGCQMPEQLLGRIIRSCSQEHELVLDPFSGSATTLAVAKKLGRRYLGFDLSEEYVKHGLQRLAGVACGDRLEGAAEPVMSAPKTAPRKPAGPAQTSHAAVRPQRPAGDASWQDFDARERRNREIQLELTKTVLVQSFEEARAGYSLDRLLVDPELRHDFSDRCTRRGLIGDEQTWLLWLLKLRKGAELKGLAVTRSTEISWEECDSYLAASEMALQSLINDGQAVSLDEILCCPQLVKEFDDRAAAWAPGFTPLEYRHAAMKIRKQAKTARGQGNVLLHVHQRELTRRFKTRTPLSEIESAQLPAVPGLYLLQRKSQVWYAGETNNLQVRLGGAGRFASGPWLPEGLELRYFPREILQEKRLAWQSCLATKYGTRLNFHELSS